MPTRLTTPPSPGDLPLAPRAAVVAAAVVFNSAVYLAINVRVPADARVVAASSLDRALGWQPWTIWPYWLLLLLAPAMALAIRRRDLFAATLRAYAVALALNASIWLAYPTRLARTPVPDGLDAATAGAWRLLHALDGPGTCFPSGHLTLPLVIGAGFALQWPRLAPATWLSITVLAPSVVTTGQHVLLDVAGGAATAFAGLALTGHPFVRRRRAAG